MSYYLPSAWKFIPLSIVQNYFQYDSVIKFDDNQLSLLQFMKMGVASITGQQMILEHPKASNLWKQQAIKWDDPPISYARDIKNSSEVLLC